MPVDVQIAPCKVNLSLKLVGLREDGYHLLDSLFWPIKEPHDILTFEARPSQNELSLSCSISDIDIKNNTLTKAYTAFTQAGGICTGVHIHLEKNIPHGAGLGGGSSDAACVLQWLNKNATKKLSDTMLYEAALKVGADVPFFLKNVPARVQGIGEEIEPVENFLKNYSILLVCPNIYISTPWAYKAYDEAQKNIFLQESLTNSAHKYKHTFSCVAQNVHEIGNDFESVVFEKHPELANIKSELLKHDAKISVMSGSGSTMVGVFATLAQAENAAMQMQHKNYNVFISTL